MNTTCATIITDGLNILVCHPTGASFKEFWSFPKGMKDAKETELDAAIRELREETGLSFEIDELPND